MKQEIQKIKNTIHSLTDMIKSKNISGNLLNKEYINIDFFSSYVDELEKEVSELEKIYNYNRCVLAYDVRDRVSPQGDSHTQGYGLIGRRCSKVVCHALCRASYSGLCIGSTYRMVAKQSMAAKLCRTHANTLVALPNIIRIGVGGGYCYCYGAIVESGYSQSGGEHQDRIKKRQLHVREFSRVIVVNYFKRIMDV